MNFLIFKGIFFILPCIDAYARVDLRTRTYDVPPQELSINSIYLYDDNFYNNKEVYSITI